MFLLPSSSWPVQPAGYHYHYVYCFWCSGNTKNGCVQTDNGKWCIYPCYHRTTFYQVCMWAVMVYSSVTASAGTSKPLTYQWRRWNGTAWANIAGATASAFTIPTVSFARTPIPTGWCWPGRCSVVISAVATLYASTRCRQYHWLLLFLVTHRHSHWT